MNSRLAQCAWLWVSLVAAGGGVASAQDPPPPPVTEIPAPAAPADEEAAPPAADRTRLSLSAGAAWGTLSGSEVENADPALGIEAAASFRLFGPFSVWGGFATSTHTVEGQVFQLLDQSVRPDLRSGNLSGEIANRRLRGGLRLDGMRGSGFRVVPYFAGGVVYATTEVTVDSVDGQPPRPVRGPDGEVVDIRSFDESRLGAILRAGAEWRVSGPFAIDSHATYEVLEFPPGTAECFTAGGGLAYRF